MAGFQDNARNLQMFRISQSLVDQSFDNLGWETFARLFVRNKLSYFSISVQASPLISFPNTLAPLPLNMGKSSGIITTTPVREQILTHDRVGKCLGGVPVRRTVLSGRQGVPLDLRSFACVVRIDIFSNVFHVLVDCAFSRFQFGCQLTETKYDQRQKYTYIRRGRELLGQGR